MVNRDGHYILTIDDWQKICKYFSLNTRTTHVKEFPQINFIEYRVYDIYTKKLLFSFFDHDGKIRIPGQGKTIAYEIDISEIVSGKSKTAISNILNAVKCNTHGQPKNTITRNVMQKFRKN